jgi:hypothetical protein
MTAITFPTTGLVAGTTKHKVGLREWVWDGGKWNLAPPAPPAALPGLGGWADISDTPTSTYTDGAGVKWNVWQFTANGTLNVTTAGLLDCLLVSGGGAGTPVFATGAGGGVVQGPQKFPAGALPVVIGAGEVWNTQIGSGATSIGTVAAPIAAAGWHGAGGTAADPSKALVSTITGTAVHYARGGLNRTDPVGPGDGGINPPNGSSGLAGIAIVRRPA